MSASLNAWLGENEMGAAGGGGIVVVDGHTPDDSWLELEDEIHPEKEAFVEVNTSLEALSLLFEDVVSAGGMSRHFAEQAKNLVPSMESIPLGYYTQLPSMTRLRPSLEEMSKGMIAAIAAAAAALIAIIYKVYKWISGKLSGDSESDATPTAAISDAKDNVKDIKEAADEFSKGTDELEKVLKENSAKFAEAANEKKKEEKAKAEDTTVDKVRLSSSEEMHPDDYTSVEKVLLKAAGESSAVMKLRELEKSALLYDAVHSSGSFVMVKTMVGFNKALSGLFAARIQSIEEVIDKSTNSNSQSDENAANAALASLEKVIKIVGNGSGSASPKFLPPDSDEGVDLNVHARLVHDEIFKATDEKRMTNLDLNKTFKEVADKCTGLVAASLEEAHGVATIMGKYEEKINELKKKVAELSVVPPVDTDNSNNTPHIAQAGRAKELQRILTICHKDLMACASIVRVSIDYYSKINNLYLDYATIYHEVVTEIQILAKSSDLSEDKRGIIARFGDGVVAFTKALRDKKKK